MKYAASLVRAALLCATFLVASCASPNPQLYTIAPQPGAELSGTPKVVEVHSVGVAQYLQRNQIVRSSDGYRVELRSNEWWGEPIEAMLGRVLVEDLAQRLPHATVFSSSSAINPSPDASVELQVQRMDLDRDGRLVFIAQSSVSFKNSPSTGTRDFRISLPPPSPGAEGQVASISTAVAQVSDGIAAMLTRKARSK
ncbi:MAG TPA: PqiC family protein [Rhodopila sp.]|jgi:uncharacterized lipoprotein YmbA|nr:PqiC family protein [Rhodopila sp.]